MTVRLINKFNICLVTIVGIYGLGTDEPYWREVGHGPWTYDYLFWLALAFNGPSGFLADWTVFKLGLYLDSGFLVQYCLWLVLLCVQWVLYVCLAEWSAVTRTRRLLVYGLSLCLFLGGCAAIVQVWQINLERLAIEDHHINVYFWPVRIGGLALAGFWVSLLTYLSTKKRVASGRASATEAS